MQSNKLKIDEKNIVENKKLNNNLRCFFKNRMKQIKSKNAKNKENIKQWRDIKNGKQR